MTARPVPWTRAERTREIGYAEAMHEVVRAGQELKEAFRALPGPDSVPFPPEVAYMMGRTSAGHFMDRIIKYASDAWLLHHDPAFFGECVSSLIEGGYGTPLAEPGGDAPGEGDRL